MNKKNMERNQERMEEQEFTEDAQKFTQWKAFINKSKLDSEAKELAEDVMRFDLIQEMIVAAHAVIHLRHEDAANAQIRLPPAIADVIDLADHAHQADRFELVLQKGTGEYWKDFPNTKPKLK